MGMVHSAIAGLKLMGWLNTFWIKNNITPRKHSGKNILKYYSIIPLSMTRNIFFTTC